VIGFAGIGPSRWRWPDTAAAKRDLLILTNFGIDEQYRRRPEGPPDQRYSRKILDHVVSRAQALVAANARLSPLLALYVYEGNPGAQKLYTDYGFVRLPDQISTDEESGRRYLGMILTL
jgi:ribosomal protein S18 acetylase RimI-like enzyme